MFISAALGLAFWSVAVLGERKLPAILQADLLFPRNETYKPVPWFPLVFAVNGLPDVWPLVLSVDMTVISTSRTFSVGDSSYRDVGLTYGAFMRAGNDSLPNTHLVHIPLVNITNGTVDNFRVRFQLNVLRRCATNGTEIERNWNSSPSSLYSNSLDFSTSPEGKVPDIEESIKACPKPTLGSSVAIRVSDILTKPVTSEISFQDECPVFEVIESNDCLYKDLAAQVAKNVSDVVLKQRRCSKGTWQDITQDCNEKQNAARMLGAQHTLPLLWAAGLILAVTPKTSAKPPSTTLVSSLAPTSTKPSNGITTPEPTQKTIVDNCEQFYLGRRGDTCDDIAAKFQISASDVINWNPSAGPKCSGLWSDAFACVGVL